MAFHPCPRVAVNACNSVSPVNSVSCRSFFAAGSHLQASSASVDEAFFLFWRDRFGGCPVHSPCGL